MPEDEDARTDEEIETGFEIADTITQMLTTTARSVAKILLTHEEAGLDADDAIIAYETALIDTIFVYIREFPEHAMWFYDLLTQNAAQMAIDNGQEPTPIEQTLTGTIRRTIEKHIIEAIPARR